MLKKPEYTWKNYFHFLTAILNIETVGCNRALED